MDTDKFKNTAQFLRLILLSYETSLNVMKAFTQVKILPTYNNSLADFLDCHKHAIYHLWSNDTRCCQANCNFDQSHQGKVLHKEQFKKIYNLAASSVPGHFIKQRTSKVVQYCKCGLSVNSSFTLEKLDISLMHTLFRHCCKLEQDEEMWFDTIREIRNKLAHMESVSVFDQWRLQKWWDKVEGSVLGLASKIPPSSVYKQSVQREISLLKVSCFDVDYAKTVFEMVKTENSKLNDTVVEENIQTRQILLKNQAEQTELLRNKIEHMKDEVIKLLNHNQAELTIELKQLVLKVVMNGIDEYVQQTVASEKDDDDIEQNSTTTKINKQTENVSKKCRVEWRLQTPDSSHVSKIANALQGATQMLSNWFQVEFVYVGSLVIVTSVSHIIFEHFEVLVAAIRSFLQYVVNVCGLDTDKPKTIDVHFTIISEQDIFRMKKDLKKIDQKYKEFSIESDSENESESTDSSDETTPEASETEQLSSSTCPQCSLCDLPIKQACSWCFECHECLCSDCEQTHEQAFKDHQTISIEEYQKLFSSFTSINKNCVGHQIKLESYCVDHDSAGCAKCIVEFHNKCSNIKPLSEVLQNIKNSFLFSDLDERASDIIECTKNLIAKMVENDSKVREGLEQFKTVVDEKRISISKHLVSILREVSAKDNEERRKMKSSISKLEDLLTSTEKIATNLNLAVKYASNFHTFCGIKTWNDAIKRKEDELVLLQNNLQYVCSVEFHIDPAFNNFLSKIKQLGRFEFKYQHPEVVQLRQERQGQHIVPIPTELDEIKLSKAHTFTLPSSKYGTDITGCCILESGIMVFADGGNKRLVLIITNLKLIEIIPLSLQPFDVASVDNDFVAVSSHRDNKLVLVDIRTGQVVRTVYNGEVCYGVVYISDKFIVIIPNDRYRVLDFLGNVLFTIDMVGFSFFCCVGTDTLYFPAHVEDAVCCCDLTGKVLWNYKCETGYYPRGITVDDQDNVFVSCQSSNKVIIIDKTGQNSKVLLTKQDGMKNPRAIYYSKKLKRLLVCNSFDGQCSLFTVY